MEDSSHACSAKLTLQVSHDIRFEGTYNWISDVINLDYLVQVLSDNLYIYIHAIMNDNYFLLPPLKPVNILENI